MKKDEIICLPNKHLRRRSQSIKSVTSVVKKLAKDMETATLDWEDSREHEAGVALAAVQIDKLKRVVVIRNSFEDKDDRSFSVFINPEITKQQGKKVEDFEGCLSVKDIYGKVPRYEKVQVKALDLAGQPIKMSAEGFLARVFQHEIDHTNGILFIDHIKKNKKAFFKLNDEGKLEPLDYVNDVKNNSLLW